MKNQPIKVVQLSSDEWLAYKNLRLEALQNDPQAFSTSYLDALEEPDSYWQSRLEEASLGHGSWFVFARENESLVGMMAACLDNEAKNSAILLSVYVTLKARGKGISKKLMAAILTAIKKDGIKKAWLEVQTEQLPAIHLYQSFGFKIVKTTHNLLGTGTYHDEYLMEKVL